MKKRIIIPLVLAAAGIITAFVVTRRKTYV